MINREKLSKFTFATGIISHVRIEYNLAKKEYSEIQKEMEILIRIMGYSIEYISESCLPFPHMER